MGRHGVENTTEFFILRKNSSLFVLFFTNKKKKKVVLFINRLNKLAGKRLTKRGDAHTLF
jgi:hypothetical protein